VNNQTIKRITYTYPTCFGIGNNFSKGQQVDFVLSNFSSEEITALPALMDKAGEMISSFCTIGPERTMNFFND